ncbi:MAG: hypothetical protein FWE13_00135 [Firmicutes bacterium]|nr:hypothetical protein [Bacillota bacterium]
MNYYDENEFENSEVEQHNTSEKHELLRLYNLIDWIDFGLIIAIIVYWVNPERFYRIPNIGLILCFISLGVSLSALIASTLIYRRGVNKSKIRLTIRYIIWGIWIPIDIFFIVRILTGMN